MSYCRFSSDNFYSDFYVYESDVGIEICVAGSRVIGDIPKLTEIDSPIFFQSHQRQMEFLKNCQHEDIKLPFAGKSFTEATPQEAIARIKELIALGYHAPAYLIPSLEEDAK